MSELDREAGRALRALLSRLDHLRPDDVAVLARIVEDEVVWVHHVELYLADYDHTVLRRLATDGEAPSADELPVRDSRPGGVFRSQTPWWAPLAAERPTSSVLWVPLTNRWQRLGVARMVVEQPTDARGVEHRAREATAIAAGLAQALDTADAYTDALQACRRRRDLSVSAEMQWDLLPPLTLSTPSVSVAGLLEPAYDVGGDCFDYASNGDTLDLAIFDPVGHSVLSSMVAALTVGTYRHARRSGVHLEGMGARLDEALIRHVGNSAFVTGQLARLDTRCGSLRWVNAGHPLPLWWRDGALRPWPRHRPDRPFGLGHAPSTVHDVALEPGDRVLFYTDGVIEARAVDGVFFGDDRLGALFLEQSGVGLDPLDSLRGLVAAVVEHHKGRPLRDDATMVVVEWGGPPSRSRPGDHHRR